MTTIGYLRSDRRKNPARHTFAPIPYADLRDSTAFPRKVDHAFIADDNGRFAEVRITSVKVWKTRPEIVVSWKYGLYEYGHDTVQPSETDTGFYSLED